MLKYLNVINDYVYLLEKKPNILFSKLYKQFKKNNFLPFIRIKEFKTFICEIIDEIEEEFPFNEFENQIEEINIKEKIKSDIMYLEKNNYNYKLFKDDDYVEMSQRLYDINKKLKRIKKKDLLNTNYSSKFFDDLKKAIENSEKVKKENFEENITKFFALTDILFEKEVNEEKKHEKIE